MARPRWLALVGGLGLLAVLLGTAFFCAQSRGWVFAVTGEEETFSQLRGLAQWAFRWTRPLPRTADDAPVTYANLPPFGINTFLEQEVDPEKRERSLQMIADAGFHWIRQEFSWEDIEIHGRGDFEDRRHLPHRSAWDKYDHIVDLAEQHHLEIIVRLSNPPAWSRAAGDANGTYAPPDNFDDYGDYVATVAARYQSRIRFYQVWNEPNIYPEWGDQPVDPQEYTRLLCLAYDRIKAAAPDAVVIAGALAPTDQLGALRPDGGNNLMDVIFLQQMYDAGAGDCFDILAVNNYMLWSGPTDRRMRPGLMNFSRPLWVRDVMVANGDAAKPIWITEMNSNVVPAGLPTNFGRVTEEQQARYAVGALERVQREWPWVGVVNVWFFKRASDQEQNQSWYYFRLVEPDFTPLPVYESLKDYLTTLEPTLYRGYHAAATWQIAYTGTWEKDGNLQRGAPGDTLTFAWEGRNLTLFSGDGDVVVRVSEDGGADVEITLHGEPVNLSRGLLERRHTLTLTVVSGDVTLRACPVR